MTNLDVWYARLDMDEVVQRWGAQLRGAERKALTRRLAKAQTRDSMQASASSPTVVDGNARIISDPPLIVPARGAATRRSTRGARRA